MNIFKKIWRAEPIIVGILGNAAVWPIAFGLLAASGHAVDPNTQHLIIGAAGLVTAGAVRQTVTAPDTLDQQLADVNAAHQKG